VRAFLYGAGAVALVIVFSPQTVRGALAASASALFEATPFLFAAIFAARCLRRHAWIVGHLGCGCGCGPSARSLPAAAATWLVFGPAVAMARYAAATLVARLAHPGRHPEGVAASAYVLAELDSIVPAALAAGIATQLATYVDLARIPPVLAALAGVVLGFAAAPCGLGAVALAGALHARVPVAGAAYLCIAGVMDLRAIVRVPRAAVDHDACAYAMLAASLALVALRHGAALVHPVLAAAIAGCAVLSLALAIGYRNRRCAGARTAPALMLAGVFVGVAPPQYYATETTMTDIFAGERLTFTGVIVRTGAASAVVRYAITCCRADAAPVVLRLNRPPPYPGGTWVRIDGRIESIAGDLRLVSDRVARVAPPVDPFVYR
jgi:hypothetical protein